MSQSTVVSLAWALVHSFWQGAVIGLVAGVVGAALGGARPAARYLMYCFALVAMLAVPIATFALIRAMPAGGVGAAPARAFAAAVAPPVPTLDGAPPGRAGVESARLVWLVRIWLAGVVVLGLRSFLGWAWAQRLKTFKASPASEPLRQVAALLRNRLGLKRAVRIVMSAAAEVPATLGWLRPIVLIPVAAVTALSPEQIELLIAHELAHVRRHDYLVNLVQTAIETLLFYHPAVWWLNARIRMEREHCCDDLAVSACGNVAAYVRALAALEGRRRARPVAIVAADGGPLLGRIRRLLDRETRRREAPPAWLGAVVPAAIVLAVALSAAPPPKAEGASSKPAGPPVGFLGGLVDAGYAHLSVDEIIALKEHGVEPGYAKAMAAAGLGAPDVPQLIRLRDHGVEPEFLASMARSGLVDDLDFRTVIQLRENDARGDDMLRIRTLGFGPFTCGEVVKLRQHGVDVSTFEALKEAGADHAGVADAIAFREYDITTDRIRDMKRQGFNNLNLEQILKLRRSGII